MIKGFVDGNAVVEAEENEYFLGGMEAWGLISLLFPRLVVWDTTVLYSTSVLCRLECFLIDSLIPSLSLSEPPKSGSV